MPECGSQWMTVNNECLLFGGLFCAPPRAGPVAPAAEAAVSAVYNRHLANG